MLILNKENNMHNTDKEKQPKLSFNTKQIEDHIFSLKQKYSYDIEEYIALEKMIKDHYNMKEMNFLHYMKTGGKCLSPIINEDKHLKTMAGKYLNLFSSLIEYKKGLSSKEFSISTYAIKKRILIQYVEKVVKRMFYNDEAIALSVLASDCRSKTDEESMKVTERFNKMIMSDSIVKFNKEFPDMVNDPMNIIGSIIGAVDVYDFEDEYFELSELFAGWRSENILFKLTASLYSGVGDHHFVCRREYLADGVLPKDDTDPRYEQFLSDHSPLTEDDLSVGTVFKLRTFYKLKRDCELLTFKKRFPTLEYL